MPALAAHPVGLLPEVKVRGEDVLGQVHRQVAEQYEEGLAGRFRAAPPA